MRDTALSLELRKTHASRQDAKQARKAPIVFFAAFVPLREMFRETPPGTEAKCNPPRQDRATLGMVWRRHTRRQQAFSTCIQRGAM